jgi:hypothetical protein
VTSHMVFLRTGSTLPVGMAVPQEPFGRRWALVQGMAADALDREIRAAGWHFMWLQDSASRRGLGLTEGGAIRSAVAHALSQMRERFNAAEIESLHVAHYLGFRVAKVELQARHIQRSASLDSVNESGY